MLPPQVYFCSVHADCDAGAQCLVDDAAGWGICVVPRVPARKGKVGAQSISAKDVKPGDYGPPKLQPISM